MRRVRTEDRAMYQRESGQRTTATDSNRMVWASTSCSYWTDNWLKLKYATILGSRVPVCPVCHSPGLQCTAGDRDSAIAKWEQENPLPQPRVHESKEVCRRRHSTITSFLGKQ